MLNIHSYIVQCSEVICNYLQRVLTCHMLCMWLSPCTFSLITRCTSRNLQPPWLLAFTIVHHLRAFRPTSQAPNMQPSFILPHPFVEMSRIAIKGLVVPSFVRTFLQGLKTHPWTDPTHLVYTSGKHQTISWSWTYQLTSEIEGMMVGIISDRFSQMALLGRPMT